LEMRRFSTSCPAGRSSTDEPLSLSSGNEATVNNA
jgi:hypothetical protein